MLNPDVIRPLFGSYQVPDAVQYRPRSATILLMATLIVILPAYGWRLLAIFARPEDIGNVKAFIWALALMILGLLVHLLRTLVVGGPDEIVIDEAGIRINRRRGRSLLIPFSKLNKISQPQPSPLTLFRAQPYIVLHYGLIEKRVAIPRLLPFVERLIALCKENGVYVIEWSDAPDS